LTKKLIKLTKKVIKTTKNDQKWIKIKLNVDKHTLITENISRFNTYKVLENRLKRVKMVTIWSKVVIKWSKMAKNGQKWPKMIKIEIWIN